MIVEASRTINLGKQGDNDYTVVKFDVSGWSAYGDGIFSLNHKRSIDCSAYPCVVSYENGFVYWTIKATDTQFAGNGFAQLVYSNEDGVIIHTEIYNTFVAKSLVTTDTPPEPFRPWVDRITGMIETETSQRMADDEELANAIDEEAGTRAANDTTLNNKIEAEAQQRAEEDAELWDAIETAGSVQDVQINGTSILDDGVANITGERVQTALGFEPANANSVSQLSESITELSDGVKSGESVMDITNKGYADDWNETDIVTYAGASEYTGLYYTHEGGMYGIELDNSYTHTEFAPYMNCGNPVYIPIDINKVFTFDAVVNGNSNPRILYDFYKEDKTQFGSSVAHNVVNGVNEIIALYPEIAYMSIYFMTMTAEVGSSFICSNFVCKDKNATNLPVILDDIRESIPTKMSQLEQDIRFASGSKCCVDALTVKTFIPNYYKDANWEDATDFDYGSYVDKKIASIPSGKHFIFVTDTHWEGNAKNSTRLMQYVSARLGGVCIAHGGDLLDKKNDKYLASAFIREYVEDMKSAFGDSLLMVLGNHDLNTANITASQKTEYTIPYGVIQPILSNPNTNVCNRDSIVDAMDITTEQKSEVKSWLATNFYLDDIDNATRYIIINTGNGSDCNGVVNDVFGVYGIGEIQGIYSWLYDVLKSCPIGFDIVLIGHMITNADGIVSSGYGQNITNIMNARREKSSVTISGSWGTWRGLWNPNTMGEMDFSNCSDIGNAIVLNGHWHYDKNSVSNGILCLTTQTDAYARSDYADAHTMTKDTVTEQCFDVVTITEDSRVVCTRFGAGNDRVFNL